MAGKRGNVERRVDEVGEVEEWNRHTNSHTKVSPHYERQVEKTKRAAALQYGGKFRSSSRVKWCFFQESKLELQL